MADRLDSRDLLEELEAQDWDTLTWPQKEVYHEVKVLLGELEENCNGDPQDGIQLIPKEDFVEYAREFAEGCGYLSVEVKNIIDSFSYERVEAIVDTWPFRHIDWQAAADDLAQDWFEIEFRGVTYLAR